MQKWQCEVAEQQDLTIPDTVKRWMISRLETMERRASCRLFQMIRDTISLYCHPMFEKMIRMRLSFGIMITKKRGTLNSAKETQDISMDLQRFWLASKRSKSGNCTVLQLPQMVN